MDEKEKTNLPSSLTNFLTVTNADGTPRTTHVEQSPLLDKLKTFLPQMAAANAKLQDEPSEEAVVVLKGNNETMTNSKKKRHTDSNEPTKENDEDFEDSDEEDLAINMDLYVDNSLGELVVNDQQEKDEEQEKKKPLIQVLKET